MKNSLLSILIYYFSVTTLPLISQASPVEVDLFKEQESEFRGFGDNISVEDSLITLCMRHDSDVETGWRRTYLMKFRSLCKILNDENFKDDWYVGTAGNCDSRYYSVWASKKNKQVFCIRIDGTEKSSGERAREKSKTMN